MIDPTTPRLEQKMDDMQERMHGYNQILNKSDFHFEIPWHQQYLLAQFKKINPKRDKFSFGVY